MTRNHAYGVDATVGLHVGDKEPVSLQPNREGGVYLIIGDNIEVTLTQSHVSALHQQSDRKSVV